MLIRPSEPAPVLNPPARRLTGAAGRIACAAYLAFALSGCAAMAPGDGGAGAGTPGPVGQETSPSGDRASISIGESASGSRETGGTSMSSEILYKLLVAELAGQRGQVDVAMDNYLEAAGATRDPAVAERAVRIAVFSRDQERGLRAARLWTEITPKNLDARRVYGALLMRAGRLEEAIEALAEIVKPPNDDETRFLLVGDMLAREKDKSAAVQVMDRIVQRHPDNIHATFAYVQLLGRTANFERALVLLDEVLEKAPEHERAIIFKAGVLQREGRTTEALNALSGYLERTPQSEAVRMTYARLLVDSKRYEDARGQFGLLSAQNPQDADVAYALGLLLLQTNRYGDAKTQFQRLVELGKRIDAAYYYLGQIGESEEDYEAALDAYQRVGDGDHRLNAQIRVAMILAEQDKVPDARAHLHGTRVNNQQETVRVYRAEAEILVRKERLQDAMTVYDTALAEYPQNSDLLYARAMLAEKLDLLDILERDLRDILSREPNNADALNALGFTLADRTDRYDEALEFIERAYELRPDDHFIVDSMGWVMYRLGRYDEALKHLRRAMEMKNDPEVAAHLGEVLWVTGDKQAARKIWDSALESTPGDKRILDVIKRFGP